MDNISFSRDRIALELKNAIRNINRNLYEWSNTQKKTTHFTISHTEVYSVSKNWLIRVMRHVLGASVSDNIFRRGNLYISVDSDLTCIKSISINTIETYDRAAATVVNDALKSIDFKELRYDPDNYKDGVFVGFEPRIAVDFSNIEKYKF